MKNNFMRHKPHWEPDITIPEDAAVNIPNEDIEDWRESLADMGEEFVDAFLASKNLGYWNEKKKKLTDLVIRETEERERRVLSPAEREQVQKKVESLILKKLIESAARDFNYEI